MVSEYVIVTLGKISGYRSSIRSAKVNIENNPQSPAPVVQTVKLAQVTPNEYVLTRSGDPTTSLTVPLQLSGTGINGVDFGRVGNTVTVLPNQTRITIVLRETPAGAANGRTGILGLGDIGGTGTTTRSSNGFVTTIVTVGGAATGTNNTTSGSNSNTSISNGTGTTIGTGGTNTSTPIDGTTTSVGPVTSGQGATGTTGTTTGSGGTTGGSSGTATGTDTTGIGTTSTSVIGSIFSTSNPGSGGLFASIPMSANLTTGSGLQFIGDPNAPMIG
jgi:hypothetical protein